MNPTYFKALVLRAKCEIDRGFYDEAIENLTNALKIDQTEEAEDFLKTAKKTSKKFIILLCTEMKFILNNLLMIVESFLSSK